MPKQKKKLNQTDVEKTGEYQPDKASAADPAPLPPSPGEGNVEGWFDSQPTFADPRQKKKRRPARPTDDLGDLEEAMARSASRSNTQMILVAVVSLTVGIAVGAVGFGQFVAGDSADCVETK